MTIASRFCASLAAIALVLAGMMAFVPSSAQAQTRTVPTGVIVGAVITATVVTVLLLSRGNDDNDDEGPQSP